MAHPWRPAGRRKNAGVNYPSVSLAVPLPHPGGRLWGRTVCGFSPFRVEKLREAVMRGCAASAIHNGRSIHARSAIHPRKAFRFSACTPHPPQAELHSASLRYGGAVARSPRIAMSPFPSKGKAFGCATLLPTNRRGGYHPPAAKHANEPSFRPAPGVSS